MVQGYFLKLYYSNFFEFHSFGCCKIAYGFVVTHTEKVKQKADTNRAWRTF